MVGLIRKRENGRVRRNAPSQLGNVAAIDRSPPLIGAQSGRALLVHALEPSVDLAFRLVLRNAIMLLQTAGELLALALDHIEVVVGELAPLLLSLAFELFPVAFNTIPIHR